MRVVKSLFVFASGVLATLYLLNIGAGVVELIPDNIPIIGNLDEVAATVLLLNCLAYFGIDLRPAGRRLSAAKATGNGQMADPRDRVA